MKHSRADVQAPTAGQIGHNKFDRKNVLINLLPALDRMRQEPVSFQ